MTADAQTPDVVETVVEPTVLLRGLHLLGLGHLPAADLNSRGLAAVAGIRARAAVAESMLGATSSGRAFPLPIALAAESTQKTRDDDVGWVASAMRQNVDHVEDLLIEDHRQEWTRSDHVVPKP